MIVRSWFLRFLPLFPVVVLVSALSALPATAQGVDLSVSVQADSRSALLRAGYGVHVDWEGDQVPADVVLTVEVEAPITGWNPWGIEVTQCKVEETRIRCSLPSANVFHGGLYLYTTPTAPGIYTAKVSVTSTTTDPRPENNRATLSVEVTGLPQLRPGASGATDSDNAVDPARAGTFRMGLQNDGARATAAELRVTLPEGGSFAAIESSVSSAEVSCSVTPSQIVCRWPELPHFDLNQFRVRFTAPDRDEGGTFPVRFEAEANEADFTPAGRVFIMNVPLRRRFRVTTAADEGAGSLRQAMRDASSECASTPCLIALRTGAEPIRPASPLPELSGFLKIDGEEAHAQLDGSMLDEGHALAGKVCELRVANLEIHDFPGHAVDVSQAAGCSGPLWRGLSVHTSELRHNLRGIVAKTLYTTIENNVLFENDRAGIFIDGASSATVRNNRIIGNGASGVFVNLIRTTPFQGWPSRALLTGNTVRDNREWGICRTRNGVVEVRDNTIVSNFLYGVDVGLDLGSPNLPSDRGEVPNKPEILSAFYDAAANQTIVRARSENDGAYGWVRVDFYASNSLSAGGYPDAEKLVGTAIPELASATFEAALPGDQRGKWLTAMTTRTVTYDWELTAGDTSELSDALRVE